MCVCVCLFHRVCRMACLSNVGVDLVFCAVMCVCAYGVAEVFSGMFESRSTCLACKRFNVRHDCFDDVTLELTEVWLRLRGLTRLTGPC